MLTQKTSGVYPQRCLSSNSEIPPQKEFSEEIDFNSKPLYGKDSSTYLSDSLSIVPSQNFGGDQQFQRSHLLTLIHQKNLTDCLNWIEQHCGYEGEAALLGLAIAQHLSAPLPSLPNEGGDQ